MDRSPTSSTVLCSECTKRMKCMANIHKQGTAELPYKTDSGTPLRLRLKAHTLDIHTTGIMPFNNVPCSRT